MPSNIGNIVQERLLDFIDWIFRWIYYWDSFSDRKLINWPFMSSPIGPLIILGIYFMIIFYGKNYWSMQTIRVEDKNGKIRYKCRRSTLNQYKIFKFILFSYNCYVAFLNAWIADQLFLNGLNAEYNFFCELVYPHTDDVFENRIAEAIWWYWASKGIELLDTVFIILKGKTSQLTFLHIYHHSSMFVVWWIGAKFVPGGSALSGALVNCVVHVLMYIYYALSSLGCFNMYIRPWKETLTILQMIQFATGIFLGLCSILSGCEFTRWMQYVFVAYAASFLVLFYDFYVETYGYEDIPVDKNKKN